MGIDVTENKKVYFNDTHQNLLDTSTVRNPSTKQRRGLIIQSIFRRKRHQRHKQDGNPLIHALKGNYGYSIEKYELLKFLSNFYEIMDKSLDGKTYNLILPLPSSHQINEYLARRIARKCPEAKVSKGFFEKKTVQEIIYDVELIETTSTRLQKEKLNLLNKLNKTPARNYFSMKKLQSHRLRKKIQPLKLVNTDVKDQKILLVDDLLASGATLVNAYNLLKEHKVQEISAICLFSGLY